MPKTIEIITGLIRIIFGLTISLWILVFFYTHAFAFVSSAWDMATDLLKNPDVWTAIKPWPKGWQ